MKFATVMMSLVLAGVFAQAQGGAAAPATGSTEGAKMEAPATAKPEKKSKKHHGKKKEKAATEEGTTK